MELDPSIHIVMHSVLSLKTGCDIYGSEAILPADIMRKSPRVEMYNEGEANEAR
jgi:hypothetical protein